MSAFIGEIEFWALIILLPVGAALVLLLAVRWTGKRTAGLLDRALQHKDEQKRQD